MCGQFNRCCCCDGSFRAARLSGMGCCCRNRDCCCERCCCRDRDCCRGEGAAPTATVSMADYESFILVPTTVFDQGDVDCGCSEAW